METNTNMQFDNPQNNQISLLENGEDVIFARIILLCPYCSYKRVFKNQFSPSKIELITVTFKVIDWLTCENCNHQLNFALDLHV